MSVSNPKYVSELNELAQLCTDCADAYRRAVDQIAAADLASFCKRRAESREMLAGQFRMRVDALGEAPVEGGTLRGTMEKLVGEARSLIGDEDKAILSELVRIEGVLKDRLEFFLGAGVPVEAEAAIRRHRETIADDFRELQILAGSAPD